MRGAYASLRPQIESLEPRLPLDGSIVINEIMYHPSSEDARDEYIELKNVTAAPVSLDGWRLTSGVDFTFPNVTIQPGEFLVIAADATHFAANYPSVTNVVGGWTGQLANSGEKIELTNQLGVREDRVTYADEGDWAVRAVGPVLAGTAGWIWDAPHDGLGKTLELINPLMTNNQGQNWGASTADGGSPGAENSVAGADIAPLIRDVSHSPGIPHADEPVVVSARLTDELPAGFAATLHWRVDGDATFQTVPMADDGIGVDELAADGVFVATIPAHADRTVIEFYVAAEDLGGKTRTWPAPVQPTGLQQANALYQVIDEFDAAALAEAGTPMYHSIMTAAERNTFTNINRSSDAQMNATFIAAEGGEVSVRYNAGVRIRGSGSRNHNPPNNRINLPGDNPWSGLSSLNINAVAVDNQLIGGALHRFAGLAADDVHLIEYYSNGQKLQGLYVHIEPLGSEFAENHFPDDPNGNVYKGRRPDESPPGGQGAGLQYFGPDPGPYVSYTKSTNESEADWSDVINLTYQLNESPDETYVEDVQSVVDVDQWFRFLALNALLGNNEGGLVTGDRLGDDYAMYSGVNDPRFQLLPHDLDTLFVGTTSGIFRFTNIDALNRLTFHPEFMPRYYAQLVDLMDNVLTDENVDIVLREAGGGSITQTRIDQVKDFFAARFAFVRGLIERDFSVDSSLGTQSGYPRTTDGVAPLSGTADVIETRSVLVNGIEAAFNTRTGAWSATLQPLGTDQTLIAQGANWAYLDDGSNQMTAWRDPAFNDSAWATGPAPLGYGTVNGVTIATTVDFGSNALDRHETTYFRRSFNVTDPNMFGGLQLSLLSDDGAAVYLNGQLVALENLTFNPAFDDLADVNLSGADEGMYRTFSIDADLLVAGENVLAVELHQATRTSGDLGFDAELIGLVSADSGEWTRPGINRITVRSFDGPTGTGNLIDERTIDIWHDTGATTDVSGTLAADTLWRAADGPFRVTGNLTIPAGVTLTIESGTTVFFADNTRMQVSGQLIAEGTEFAPIFITREPGSTGFWNGIQFVDTMTDNRIGYAILEYGETVDGMIGLTNASLTLHHATLDHQRLRRIRSQNSSLIVRDSHFVEMFPGANEAPLTDNRSEHIWGGFIPVGGHFIIENNVFGALKGHNDGIDFDAGRRPDDPIPQILNNVFLGGGDDALDLEGDAHIEGNVFMHYAKDQYNVDPGESNVISAGANHEFVVVRNIFYDVQHASLIKEDSFMTFEHNTVINASHSALYFDLPGQTDGPGRGAIVRDNIFANVATVFDFVADTTDLTVESNLALPGLIPYDPDTLTEDPRIVDVLGGNFALGQGSPAIGAGIGGLDLGALIPAGANFSGEPSTLTHLDSATIQVHAPGSLAYRFRVNGGAWSTDRMPSDPIVLTGLADGPYTVEAIVQNSASAWQEESQATASRTWTVDSTLTRLVISEVMASNTGVLVHEGTTPDAIELHNAGAGTIDLSGMGITDNVNLPYKYAFPAGTTLAAGEYLTLYADNAVTSGIHLGFTLRGEGDDISLFAAPANGGAIVDSITFGMQLENFSIARLGPDLDWGLAQPTLGAANVAQRTGDLTELAINEWFTSGDIRFIDDFVELRNTDPLPVALGGLYLSDDPAPRASMTPLPALSFISGAGYLALLADSSPEQGANHLDFGLSTRPEVIYLFDASLQELDSIYYGPQAIDVSQGRVFGDPQTYESELVPTPGVANPGATTTQSTLVDFDHVWRYDNTDTDLGAAWRDPAFDDSAWPDGPGPLGFELDPLPIPLATVIANGPTTTYFRSTFDFNEDPANATLLLTTMIDDGLVVYLNGHEIQRLRMPDGEPTHATIASGNVNEAVIEGAFEIPSDFLVQGENVLAAEVHQHSSGADIVFGLALDAEIRIENNAYNSVLAMAEGLRISELHYNPATGSEVEFVELQNIGGAPLNLGGVRLADGIDFTFPAIVLEPEQYVVVTNNVAGFFREYGSGILVAGQYSGTLSNNGEGILLQLAAPYDAGILRFDYLDGWYPSTDGGGYSLEIRDALAPATTWGDKVAWQAGTTLGGTPGYAAGQMPPVSNVVINEVLTHTDLPAYDAIELFNRSDAAIDLGGWYLSDSDTNFQKFRIPDGTIIPAGGFVVFDERDFNASGLDTDPANDDPNDFGLNGAHGDELWLVEADTAGNLLRMLDLSAFGAAANGESFGRWTDGEAPFVPLQAVTLGAPNAPPRVGPLIISEVHYNPVDPDGAGPVDPGDLEFVEVFNPTRESVGLTEWRIRGGVDFDFASTSAIAPFEALVVVSFNPTNTALLDQFRAFYGIDDSVQIVGGYAGQLSNGGEDLRLLRPDEPPLDEPLYIPRLLEDELVYDDAAPWPTSPDGGGDSLHRAAPDAWGLQQPNWMAAAPTPGDYFGLFVRSAAIVSGGIEIEFSKAIDLGQLNLYDGIDAEIDPADLLLVGRQTGPVRGSIVIDPAASTLTFVPSGAPLAPDVYDLTLFARSDGFVSLNGETLDGDFNFSAGGNYVTQFTVGADAARTLSIRDFARGPLQSFSLPNGQGVPVSISDSTGVTAVEFVLRYDETNLQNLAATLTDQMPGLWSITSQARIAPGEYRVVAQGPALDGSVRELIAIQGEVPASAASGSASLLTIQQVVVNQGALAASGDVSLQAIGFLGDATGNMEYSALDASLIARVAVGLDSGFDAFDRIDPMILGDVSDNGEVSALDAAYVARKAVGLAQPEIPVLPPPANISSNVFVSSPAALAPPPGEPFGSNVGWDVAISAPASDDQTPASKEPTSANATASPTAIAWQDSHEIQAVDRAIVELTETNDAKTPVGEGSEAFDEPLDSDLADLLAKDRL
ncbi:MAG: lamin tail domain-containing protein [Planctomycetales bacterium]|nr:lamin tail domain-containing protein [Planctomycetales bacterium]